jgi:acetoin utilization deacetylase AcuC-like enzyme
MKVFVPSRHHLHRPAKDFSDGLPPFEHMERPERIGLIMEGLKAAGISDFVEVAGSAMDVVLHMHDRTYVEFLLELSRQIKPDHEYLPPIFHDDLSAAPLWFRGGTYCREIGTPIGPHTVEAALNSAATAIAAAQHTLAVDEDSFALCRPPGHHAGLRRYGGYSFFNNAYLAAGQFGKAGHYAPILDIDYHLGDGSAEFACPASPYYSLHAHPGRNYPYLASLAAAERPHITQRVFAAGVTAEPYLRLLSELVTEMELRIPNTVILSLGFDTLGIDYIQDEETAITVEDFALIGAAIATIRSPIVFILEGGYDPENLSACAERFFSGFLDARRRQARS